MLNVCTHPAPPALKCVTCNPDAADSATYTSPNTGSVATATGTPRLPSSTVAANTPADEYRSTRPLHESRTNTSPPKAPRPFGGQTNPPSGDPVPPPNEPTRAPDARSNPTTTWTGAFGSVKSVAVTHTVPSTGSTANGPEFIDNDEPERSKTRSTTPASVNFTTTGAPVLESTAITYTPPPTTAESTATAPNDEYTAPSTDHNPTNVPAPSNRSTRCPENCPTSDTNTSPNTPTPTPDGPPSNTDPSPKPPPDTCPTDPHAHPAATNNPNKPATKGANTRPTRPLTDAPKLTDITPFSLNPEHPNRHTHQPEVAPTN